MFVVEPLPCSSHTDTISFSFHCHAEGGASHPVSQSSSHSKGTGRPPLLVKGQSHFDSSENTLYAHTLCASNGSWQANGPLHLLERVSRHQSNKGGITPHSIGSSNHIASPAYPARRPSIRSGCSSSSGGPLLAPSPPLLSSGSACPASLASAPGAGASAMGQGQGQGQRQDQNQNYGQGQGEGQGEGHGAQRCYDGALSGLGMCRHPGLIQEQEQLMDTQRVWREKVRGLQEAMHWKTVQTDSVTEGVAFSVLLVQVDNATLECIPEHLQCSEPTLQAKQM